jgi:hypothetical protein
LRLQDGGFGALHPASVEAGRLHVLLTTDDKFVKRAFRGEGKPLPKKHFGYFL